MNRQHFNFGSFFRLTVAASIWLSLTGFGRPVQACWP